MASRDEARAVQTAIDLTLRTIEQRARLFRKLVAVVSLLLVVSGVTSVVLTARLLLGGLILITLAIRAYLALDARLVGKWVSMLFELRDTTGTNLDAFSSALHAHPLIPHGTLQGMLAQLTSPMNHAQTP
jgi:hypothetical protein